MSDDFLLAKKVSLVHHGKCELISKFQRKFEWKLRRDPKDHYHFYFLAPFHEYMERSQCFAVENPSVHWKQNPAFRQNKKQEIVMPRLATFFPLSFYSSFPFLLSSHFRFKTLHIRLLLLLRRPQRDNDAETDDVSFRLKKKPRRAFFKPKRLRPRRAANNKGS